MYLPWSARQNERTCAGCGYAWRVPRQFAHKNVVSVWGATSGLRSRAIGGPSNVDLQAGMAIAEQAASFRACPKWFSAVFAASYPVLTGAMSRVTN